MHDVNGWLMTLAFLLGLLLTFAMTIRKVTREVPEGRTVTANLRGSLDTPQVTVSEVKAPDLGKVAAVVREPHVDTSATATTFVSADDLPAGPHGRGTVKPYADGTGPAGWTIKGNEDSMLYHTVDSPNYQQTIAEIWFVDEETAIRAGFKRWDVNRRK